MIKKKGLQKINFVAIRYYCNEKKIVVTKSISS
jgi:hypothetical protein